MAITCSGKKCSFVYSLFVLVAMVATLWFVWFGGDVLLSKDETKNDLSKLSNQLSDVANDYGSNVKITHGAIESDGWGLNKRSIIRDMNIEITGKNPGDLMNFTIGLGDVVTYADTYNNKKTVIETSKKIGIYQNGNLVKSIIFSEPLLYSYLQPQFDSSGEFQHNITLPKNISLSSENIVAHPEAGQDSTDAASGVESSSVSFAVNPTIELISTERHLSRLSYDLSGLTLTNNGEKAISVGALKSQFNEEEGDDEGRRAGKYNFVADDIVFHKGEAATKPYSFNINTNLVFDSVSKEPAQPQSSADALKSHFYNELTPSQNREVTLNNFIISNPDFQLKATGNFANTIGDPLPSGEVNVDIDNVQNFLNSEIIAMQGKALIESGLTKIIGLPLSDQQQASFALKRERNGVFYIGKTTFEELVASMLSGSVIGRPSNNGRLPENELPMRAPVTNDEGNNKFFEDTGAGKVDLPAPVEKP